jgi:segregation and condensation protein A
MTLFTNVYSVDLDVFQGPLDLLLYLIRKDEIDIYDIPVARITEQYLRYVEMLKLLNLENAGDYILMAATLIRIKAQMLLPRDPLDDDELDPREELTLALLEYKKFKEAGDILSERREIEARLTSVAGRTNGYKGAKTVLVQDTSLFDLLTAFHAVMARITDDTEYLVDHQGLTVEDRIAVLRQFFAGSEYATFEQLFADIRSKIVAILTFLAVLEMTRMHLLAVRQAMPFSEIRVYRIDRAPVAESALLPDADPPTIMEEVAADS